MSRTTVDTEPGSRPPPEIGPVLCVTDGRHLTGRTHAAAFALAPDTTHPVH
ncbi:hypothetical protein [Streptomyces sp. V4I2]|uniref:hypothetical protein n=1 Tax=Streptomyces sp. V4I2 TaxID=3042280 RepID=UPI00278998EF|nr:hypothetical protein [Streptomyces sp. V4I2]MDQ1047773.1 hypothetical protein [Streptomyces sp. V4I2]